MNQAQTEMDEAVAHWLEAYQGHEHYISATKELFEVFARSWQGSRRYVTEAFTDFRKALLKEHGFKRIEVVAVFSQKRPDGE